MQQPQYVNPASVIGGRKILARTLRMLSLRRAIPYFIAARDMLGILFLIPLYLYMRLPNLMALPVFYDETIYLSYAREYMQDPARNVLISAERDGKPPLFIWGLSWFWNLFPDPLLGARFMSVIGGGLACIFVYMIGRRLLNPVAGFLSALFFILSPIMVLHNRLAVHTSWETAAGMATLYLAIAIAQQPRAMYALGLGASIGLGMFIKQSALFYFGLAPLVAFLIHRRPDVQARLKLHEYSVLRKLSIWWYSLRKPRLPRFALQAASISRRILDLRENSTIWKETHAIKQKRRWERALDLRTFLYMALVGFVGLAVAGSAYLPLQTHPEASYLSSTDTSYAFSINELLELPLEVWHSNFSNTWEWWLTYLNVPLLVLALAAFGYAMVRPRWGQAEIALVCWAVLPLVAQMLLARQHWFTRYITPFSPTLMLLAALAIVRLGRYLIRVGRERLNWTGASGVAFGVCLTLIVLTPWFRLDDQLLNRPLEAEMASRDRWQYIEGWPSGYGLEETVAHLRELAASEPLLLYIDQNNVTPELYFMNRFGHLKGWVNFGRTTGVNWTSRNFRSERNTYYITTVPPDDTLRPYLVLSKTISKPGGRSSISIYHFVPYNPAPQLTIYAEGN
jgi:4-amino-4-deoxy-L-arabinose transferase-like glycosyltransferase